MCEAFEKDEIFEDPAEAIAWLTDQADADELKEIQNKIIAIIEGKE